MKRRLTRLGVGAVATISAAGALAVPAAATEAPSRPSDVKNIILFIGDGMGVTHVTAGRQRYYGAAGRLNMEKLPVTGQVSTYAVEDNSSKPALVTDSASSGTAWSSGVKTYNAAIGVDAYGNRVDTIMEQAKDAGMRTGNVTTAEVTDATPAAMMSHALLRGCQGPTYSAAACLPAGTTAPSDTTLVTPIAEQIARNGTADVIFGGGLSRFEPDDQAALVRQGYTVLGSFGSSTSATQTATTQRVATRNDLAGARSNKVIGLFNRGNLTVEANKALATPTAVVRNEPTLPEMTRKAIDLLKGTEDGFLLQVEGALIDKRSHANDARQTLGEIKAFDDAVKAAKDFAERDGNTLVIVTADHECAGFNIIEPGTYTNAEAVSPPGNVDGSNTANNSVPSRTSGGARDPLRSNGIVNGPSVRPAPSATAPSAAPSTSGAPTTSAAPVASATPTAGATPSRPASPSAAPSSAAPSSAAPSSSASPSSSAAPTTGLYGSGDPRNFAPATFRTPDDPAGVQDGSSAASLWLSYLSGNHTGADVPIYAYGPESNRFAGTQDNTDLYDDMYDALRALGNKSSAPSPMSGQPFTVQVQVSPDGTVSISISNVAQADPYGDVDLYAVEGGKTRYLRTLALNAAGKATSAPATIRAKKGSQQTYLLQLQGKGGSTTSQTVTTYVK